MNSNVPNHPQNREGHNEHNEWTVLVRVGENEWRINDDREAAPDSAKDTEDASRPHEWQARAKQYQRKVRFRTEETFSLAATVKSFARVQLVRIRDWLSDVMGPLLGTEPDQDKPRTLWSERVHRNSAQFQTGYGSQHRQSPLAAAAGRRRNGERKLTDSLQLGAILGLLLGCFSLVLFHQMAPIKSVPAATPDVVATTTVAGNAAVMTNVDTRYVSLPAIAVDAVQIGPFQLQKKAQATAATLIHKGISGVVYRDKSGYRLLTAVSLHSSSLNSFETKLKKLNYTGSIQKISFPVTPVQAANGARQADMNEISQWLTAAVSSLNAITGVSMDGEAMRDAQVSYNAAKKMIPTKQIQTESGYASQLTDFQSHWQKSFLALTQNKKSLAMENTLGAYVDLMNLRQGG